MVKVMTLRRHKNPLPFFFEKNVPLPYSQIASEGLQVESMLSFVLLYFFH